MRLHPVGLREPSTWTDGGWFEKPGHPSFDGCWIHVPREGQCLPEFYFEDHDKIKGEPPPELLLGSGPDCHVRLDPKRFPMRLCRIFKRQNTWYIEALLPIHEVSLQGDALEVGRRSCLRDGDIIGLAASVSYRIDINFETHDQDIHPNRYPARFPCRPAT